MNWNRLQYAGLLVLASFASACAEDVGACTGSLQGRDTVVVNNMVVYGGQAIINRGCTTGCHSSTAAGADRRGVPRGLDFDLNPIDEEDATGTKKSGSATILKLKAAQVAGLRARQKKIVEQRNLIWEQVQDGLMPPGGMFDSVMSNIFASSEKTPCKAGKEYSKIPEVQTREVLRNWLACGAPLVETNGSKVDKSSAAGAAGYQYPACVKEPDAVVTLDTLFKTTLGDCGGCHNSSITGPPEFASVEVLAASLRTKSVCAGKRFVVPGKPEDSYMLDLLKGPNPDCMHEQMPKGEPLSARGIAEVTAWIAAGAPTTADDLSSEPQGGDDEPTAEADDEQVPDPDADDDTATSDVDVEKDAGAPKDAGLDAGKDAGSDAGKDAGRDAGKDAGRDAGK
ncbi:MAG: hypothetical protein RLZZ450_3116 [Pseudomonadota bacterium]|jgi:hypothetical protein